MMDNPIQIEMEHTSFITDFIFDDNEQRPFECPCGKKYKSYPALYTHIKIKHEGKPPGEIKKADSHNRKRGRPAVRDRYAKSQFFTKSSEDNTSTSILSNQQMRQTLKRNFTHEGCISKISQILRKFPSNGPNRTHLNKIQSILQMNIFLASKKVQLQGYHIGFTIQQLLQTLSKHIPWRQFQQFYTLIMLLVQFIIDKTNNTEIVSQGSVDLLCDHINEFLQGGLETLVQCYEVGELEIFREENMFEVFQYFFQWLMLKKYTNYRITLNCNFKKVETQSQF